MISNVRNIEVKITIQMSASFAAYNLVLRKLLAARMLSSRCTRLAMQIKEDNCDYVLVIGFLSVSC
jgi:hypothetical protein